jgi:hypothetical protein
VSRLLVFAYLVEAGLLLAVVPWSAFWERNAFIEHVPVVREVLLNHFARGAVSGVGLVCLWAALAELAMLIASRRAPPAAEVSGGAGEAGARREYSTHR